MIKPRFFDVHGHPNFAAFEKDRDEVVKRALDSGVWLAAVGTQKDTSRAAVELAEKYKEGVYAIVGLHPIHTGKSFHDKEELGEGGREFTSRGEQFDFDFYKKLAASPKVVAIGECGMDYYRVESQKSKVIKLKQEENFRKQIELAIEVKKPLMLHLRSGENISAYKNAYKILSTFDFGLLTADLHFFAGSIEEAKPFLDSGFYFSFTGAITYPPRKGESAGSYDEIIKYLPLDRILAETDCPFVSPAPYRGKRNEPLYVTEVVKKIAEIRNEDFEKVREQLFNNALSFFRLNS